MYTNRFLSNSSHYAFSRHTLISLLGMIMLPLALAGCSDNPVGNGEEESDYERTPATAFEVGGTIERQETDGGAEAWIIESDRGQNYLPVNLRRTHLTEGMEVRAKVHPVGVEQLEDRRYKIDRSIPEPEILNSNLGMVVKVESIEILGEVGEQAQTAQIVWEGHFFKAM
jgi:hypothetical protein